MLGNSWPIPLDMYEWIEHDQVGLITLTLNLWIDLLLLWMPTNIKALIPNPILVILLIYYYEGRLHTKNQLYVSNDYRDIGLLRNLQSDCSIAFSVIIQEWNLFDMQLIIYLKNCNYFQVVLDKIFGKTQLYYFWPLFAQIWEKINSPVKIVSFWILK